MAWYEEQEISFEDARKSVKNSLKNEKISDWILEQCLQDEYKQYNSFGSYRGFYTFVEPSILKVARRKNEIARRKLALQTLRRAIPLKVWINSILYRPPSKNNHATRYEKIKANFEAHQIILLVMKKEKINFESQ